MTPKLRVPISWLGASGVISLMMMNGRFWVTQKMLAGGIKSVRGV